MTYDKLNSRFLQYLIDCRLEPGEKLPSISEISGELGVSAGKVRESLEVARQLGFVSVKPKVGILKRPFSFTPAVLQTLLFGLGSGEAEFSQFSQLRQAVEMGFWDQAVQQLTSDDIAELKRITQLAWEKLRGQPVRIPNGEHRQLHLTIFKHLENPFVQGILHAYWEAYEASELTRFVTYQYWLDVWNYHEKIVAALEQKEFALGKQLLIEHFALLPAQVATYHVTQDT